MSRIDRIRRASLIGGAIKADPDTPEEVVAARTNLPALRPAPRPLPAGDRDGAAVFTAQLMGQDGQKRGLRAGPPAIEAARGAYNKVEWSGSKDRRARVGRKARTEI